MADVSWRIVCSSYNHLAQWFLTFFRMTEHIKFYMIFEKHDREMKQYFYIPDIIENYIHNNSHILVNRK